MSTDRLAVSDGVPVLSHTRGPIGIRISLSHSQPVFRHVCQGARDPPFYAPIRPQRRPTVQRRLPGPPPRGQSAIALPQSRSRSPRPFCNISVAPLPAMWIVRRRRVWLVIAPPLPARPCQRSNSDHTSKRYVLG